MQMVIGFLFQTCLSKTKAICMSHISLNQMKNFPWDHKESNDQISLHLIRVILSTVSLFWFGNITFCNGDLGPAKQHHSLLGN